MNFYGRWTWRKVEMSELVGLVFDKVEHNKSADEELIFHATDGRRFHMYHDQDCCERVRIEDMDNDLAVLVGTPILQAEVVTSNEGPINEEYDISWTWTFYKFATAKGHITIRWYGTSNGYYSESVGVREAPLENTVA